MIPLTNPYVWLGGVSALALTLAAGFGLGHHQKTLEDRSAALSAAQKAVQTVAKQSAATSAIDQHTAAQMAKTQDNTNALVQRIPIYVTKRVDDQCVVGAGAVRLLDLAAANAVPGAAVSLPDADPALADPAADSGVTLSAIVQANAVNAGNYGQLAEGLNAWNVWYDGLNPAWKKAHPGPR